MQTPTSLPANPTFEQKVRFLYRVYEALRMPGAPESSQTARMLASPDPNLLRARLADELVELAGVAEGTHIHQGLPEDAILEASQVCYWAFVTGVAAGEPYEALSPHTSLLEARAGVPLQGATLGPVLAEGIRGGQGFVPVADLRAVFRHVGLTCRALGVDVSAPIDRDLEAMRTRPYLRAFFQDT